MMHATLEGENTAIDAERAGHNYLVHERDNGKILKKRRGNGKNYL